MTPTDFNPPSAVIKSFFEAARNNDTEKLRWVFDTYGKRMANIENGDGSTALMNAATNGSANALRFLLANGAEIDCQDAFNGTAMLYATCAVGLSAGIGEIECMTVLLEHGANLTLADSDNETPLSMAKEASNGVALRILNEWIPKYDTRRFLTGIESPLPISGGKLKLQKRTKEAPR